MGYYMGAVLRLTNRPSSNLTNRPRTGSQQDFVPKCTQALILLIQLSAQDIGNMQHHQYLTVTQQRGAE